MRIFAGLFVCALTITFIFFLDKPLGNMPAIGKLLDPIKGCWVAAEPVNKNIDASFGLPGLQQEAIVWFDERLVAHIQAANDHDLYFIQGYIHAYFRLWQMDMETRAAAGRISEVAGEKALTFDRTQRRKGMVYGAENSLTAMESEPHTKTMIDAYTAGVNKYISSLRYWELPIEYKLMNFKPEQWTNIKTALLLKYMADDLTGYSEDIPLTILRDSLPSSDFNLLFPEKIAEATPVIPTGTVFAKPSLPALQTPNDTVWAHFKMSDFTMSRAEGVGSNSWAISGINTSNGWPILCNDPHLALNLPSLWYEVQLTAPGIDVYGVSLPGAPGVIIGFNDNIAWGFTNNYRDVKDHYLIKPVNNNNKMYWYAGRQMSFSERIEHIQIKGQADFTDTVKYTIHGPVMYDENFEGPGGLKKAIAVCWTGHQATNELLSIYCLNRANDYAAFTDAIIHFECPGQNMVYADRVGNIAMWGQGKFVHKWKGQGRFVMNGADSSASWKDYIPMHENPHVLNPPCGYVSSANQETTDSTYPYWYIGYFKEFRAWRINSLLSSLKHATVQDMFRLQNDTYSILAASVLPDMLNYLPVSLTEDEMKYYEELKKWDYYLRPTSIAATIFQIWWEKLYQNIWQDNFEHIPVKIWPSNERTMQLIKRDSSSKFFNNWKTLAVEHLRDVVSLSYIETIDSIYKLEKGNKTEWYKAKNTAITHLAKLQAFSFNEIKIGGWGNAINAATNDHGPSWRMVVQAGNEMDAYGIYPGGQSGNPGSKYYSDFIADWAQGKYYHLHILKEKNRGKPKNMKYKWEIKVQ